MLLGKALHKRDHGLVVLGGGGGGGVVTGMGLMLVSTKSGVHDPLWMVSSIGEVVNGMK